MKLIKVSIKYMNQLFHPCTLDFISNICKGSCCRKSSGGVQIVINNREIKKYKKYDVKIIANFLQSSCDNKCYFQKNNLCVLHNTQDKPYGCVLSPFILNKKDTLIVRNRYRLLKCYRVSYEKVPVYIAHRKSLEFIFGEKNIDDVIEKIKKGNDFYYGVQTHIYNIIRENIENIRSIKRDK